MSTTIPSTLWHSAVQAKGGTGLTAYSFRAQHDHDKHLFRSASNSYNKLHHLSTQKGATSPQTHIWNLLPTLSLFYLNFGWLLRRIYGRRIWMWCMLSGGTPLGVVPTDPNATVQAPGPSCTAIGVSSASLVRPRPSCPDRVFAPDERIHGMCWMTWLD